MPDYRIGIDPGLTGAVALIRDDECLAVADMPTMGEGAHRIVSGALLADLVGELAGQCGERPTAVLEAVSAMPGEGVSSSFKFGRSVGVIEGVLGAHGLAVVYAKPGTWKRRAGLIGAAKDDSRRRALELFPERSVQLARKRDCGRAEAMLIGFFGHVG